MKELARLFEKFGDETYGEHNPAGTTSAEVQPHAESARVDAIVSQRASRCRHSLAHRRELGQTVDLSKIFQMWEHAF